MALPSVGPLKFVAINNAAASGDTTLVAAVAGKRYIVVNYAIVATGAVAVKFKDGTTDITGAMALAANGGVSFASDPTSPAFTTSINSALIINAGGAVQVSGHIAYIEQTR